MCRFIETVCLEEGQIVRPSYHNARMNAVRRERFGASYDVCIEDIIDAGFRPQQCTRCRVSYGADVMGVEYFPYCLRKVQTLNLVSAGDAFDYHLKSSDRSGLDALFALRDTADDVLIVRSCQITDTSIGNVALFDGKRWFTPSNPLLKGTHRQFLLDEGRIFERNIRVEDLCNYSAVRIFNAMIHWGEIELPVSSVLNFRK